jgi:Zn-dependent M28 family amino/carboxypeptidase
MTLTGLTLLSAAAIACGAISLQQTPPRFDGAQAFGHVREQVAIGPRPAGSTGAERTRAYITAHLKSLGITTEEQPFDASTPAGKIRMVNLRATLPGTAGTTGPRLIIASHYDTKLFKGFPFVGANDGGSSTAVLLELATALKDRKFALPIELLFFDGEEAVIEWKNDDHTYGSRYYVDAARKSGGLKDIRALVLVDMVGDRDLRIQREPGSTEWLTDLIWGAAKRIGRKEFVDDLFAVEDDHVPFLRAGVPAVDLIDLDYPAWHTADDTLDQIAPESLQAVGDVILAALPDLMEKLEGAGK